MTATPSLARMTKAQLLDKVQELQRWRDAVNDALISAQLGPLRDDVSPVMAMDWLICQHLEVAERERVEPLTDWQIAQLDLNCKHRIDVVREVERALGVVAPGDDLVRVSVPVQVPAAARGILDGVAGAGHDRGADRAQAVWDDLLHAGGAIAPVTASRPSYQGLIKARPAVSIDPTKPKLRITGDMLKDGHETAQR